MIESKDMLGIIFVAYSHIAVGIIKRLPEEKIKIPEGVPTMYMNDISMLPYNSEKIDAH